MNTERSPFALYADCPIAGAASVNVDPFSTEFLADPYPQHQLLREAGSLLWLSRYAIAATARYEEVSRVLKDWQTFSSARGVGMSDFNRHERFRLPSIILEADPPQHSRSRAALNKAVAERNTAGTTG